MNKTKSLRLLAAVALAGLTVATAKSQNIFVSNWNGGTISEFDPSGAIINANFISGLSYPYGLAFDSSGNLYVANAGSGVISQFDAGGTLINATFASGLNSPRPEPSSIQSLRA